MKAEETVRKAREQEACIPAFNVPHLPMVKPVIQAVVDENSIAMVQIARVEWEKFEAESLERVAEEYEKYKKEGYTLLHLDHIPVIDEDYQQVDYIAFLERTVRAGYQSLMVDGSRLPLEENIRVTKEAVRLAHEAGIACEAELGAVMGHENREMPPYEEIFASRTGFTKTEEAERFVKESGCSWLSVAVGNVHGQIAEAFRDRKKPQARLDVEHIRELHQAVQIPLVLHGGSGVRQQDILEGIAAGIAKINVGTELRQTYEAALKEGDGDVSCAQDRLYHRVRAYIADYLHNTDLKDRLSQ